MICLFLCFTLTKNIMNCFALNPLHLPSLNILWHSSSMNKSNYEWRDPYVLRRKMIHTSGEFDSKFASEIAFVHAQCIYLHVEIKVRMYKSPANTSKFTGNSSHVNLPIMQF